MRSFVLVLWVLSTFSLTAQKTVTGKVVTQKNTPLEGAAVYLNNTSIGTTTNENGEFELSIKEGTYDLIASFLGFETAQFALDTRTLNQSITFKLSPKANMLNEVVVSNKHSKISPEDRAYFLSQFKLAFLGKTNLSYECKILNENDIDFDYNRDSGLLEAYTSKPIEIDHKGLGYKIYYDLVHFELTPKTVTFLGYTRYENKKGSKRKQRKWRKKRKIAYNGSLIHFLQSVMNDRSKEEGFVVDHFQRIPNPARPSDSIIRLAREHLKKISGHNTISISLSDNVSLETSNKTANYEQDSLLMIVRKARLNRMVDMDLKQNISTEEFSEYINGGYYLKFPHYLKIKYMKEPEEDNFRRGAVKLDHQVSMVTLYVNRAKIDPIGVLVNPLDMFLEGYWSYEKIGDALPLDYNPDN